MLLTPPWRKISTNCAIDENIVMEIKNNTLYCVMHPRSQRSSLCSDYHSLLNFSFAIEQLQAHHIKFLFKMKTKIPKHILWFGFACSTGVNSSQGQGLNTETHCSPGNSRLSAFRLSDTPWTPSPPRRDNEMGPFGCEGWSDTVSKWMKLLYRRRCINSIIDNR